MSFYGTSKYLGPPEGEKLVGEAELWDFAPCPCVCCQCFVPDKARGRTYIRAYENRIETNWPIFPCCCCSNERCMTDNARILFYDKQPSRAGMCCYCVPCVCCGPPVVFNHIPRCCFSIIDCRPCCGETIRHAPCNCANLRCCLCCGTPCYFYYSYPMFWPVKNGEVFLAQWKGALEAYREKHDLPKVERARFKRVADRFCDCDSVKNVNATPWPPQSEKMDRGGDDTKQIVINVHQQSVSQPPEAEPAIPVAESAMPVGAQVQYERPAKMEPPVIDEA